MNEVEVIDICRQAVIVLLKIMGPILLAGLTVGVLVSLFQTVTSVQEMTLTFIPKMVVMFTLTIFLLPFMLTTLKTYTNYLADKMVQVGMTDTSNG